MARPVAIGSHVTKGARQLAGRKGGGTGETAIDGGWRRRRRPFLVREGRTRRRGPLALPGGQVVGPRERTASVAFSVERDSTPASAFQLITHSRYRTSTDRLDRRKSARRKPRTDVSIVKVVVCATSSIIEAPRVPRPTLPLQLDKVSTARYSVSSPFRLSFERNICRYRFA